MNFLLMLWPGLFGCRRVLFPGVSGDKGSAGMFEALDRLGAIKIGETGLVDVGNYFFKLDEKRFVVIEEEYMVMRVIAAPSIIARIESEIGSKSIPWQLLRQAGV